MVASKKSFNRFLKGSIFLLIFALLLSFTTFTANAMTTQDSTGKLTLGADKVSKVVKLKNVNVSILEDGRIKAINNPESLTKEERTVAMKLMKFSDAEIESYSDLLINDILADGGVKVELTQEEYTHIYTDSKGKDHIVTPENMEQINEIKKKDLQVYNLNSGIGTLDMGGKTDGAFTGKGVATYLGKTSNGQEFQYKYRTTFEWSTMPALTFVDNIATAWQTHTTPVSSSAAYDRWANGGFSHTNKITLDNSSVVGTKARIDLQNAPGRHYGYIEDSVRIPVTAAKGTTGAFSSAYSHSHAPGWIGIGINIGPVGTITFDTFGTGDKWSWRNTFSFPDK